MSEDIRLKKNLIRLTIYQKQIKMIQKKLEIILKTLY